MKTIKELCDYIQREERDLGDGFVVDGPPVARIQCKDGFNLSVQAGETLYCTPRQRRGPWTEVEIGFPSERVESFMPYAEEPENPTDTVYGYVPIELVLEAIAEHGGVE